MRSGKYKKGILPNVLVMLSVAMIKKQLEKGKVCFGLKFHKKSPHNDWGGMEFGGQSRKLRDHISITHRK